jgi:hypothetical protein
MGQILSMFRKHKRLIEEFNNGQLAYMASYCWSDLKRVEVNEEILRSDMYIHCHLGYLRLKADDPSNPYYTVLTTIYFPEKKRYRRFCFNQNNASFQIRTVLNSMELSPLTGLICTGIDSEASDVLVDGNYNKILVIEAIGYSLAILLPMCQNIIAILVDFRLS